MAQSDSPPADARTFRDGDAAEKHSSLPNPADNAELTVDMVDYRKKVPVWERVWRHSFTQMMLLSMQAFCGPAMSDAIAGTPPSSPSRVGRLPSQGFAADQPIGLGGGGLATPQTSNTA